MTITPEFILGIFLAWQIGSMPIPVWIGRAFYAFDIRHANNPGDNVENIFTNISWYTAATVFALEFIKGWGAVSIALLLDYNELMGTGLLTYKLLLITAVIIGQLKPVFGELKSVNSLGVFFGLFFSLWPFFTVVSVGVFLLFWILTKRVTISSIILALGMMIILTLVLLEAEMLVIALMLSFVVTGIQIMYYQQRPKLL